MRKPRQPRIVVDYDRCIRVPEEDRKLARPSTPYHCRWCIEEGFFTGILVFEGDSIPSCGETHESLFATDPPLMVPSGR